jgi:predicted nucleotide-binding protein
MMRFRQKPDPVEEFNELRSSAEKYISYPKRFKGTTVSRWRNKCLRWLVEYVPDAGLSEEMLTVPAGSHGRSQLSRIDVRSVQRGLEVLLKAREFLPALSVTRQTRLPRAENARKVFIVHGHNDALKTTTARLITKLGLEPIILHEQPNKGRTVIEKFLDHSDVAFALVLLTGDDRGGLVDQSAKTFSLRARQNVILELGYFIGRLGRNRVAAIYEAGVEIPSDYGGVLFIQYDSQGVWQYQAAKEMRAAGVKLDMNRI